MKVMICNDCGQMVVPEKAGQWSWCLCGNIGGMYISENHFQVAIREAVSGRLVELPDSVLHGRAQRESLRVCSPEEEGVEDVGWDKARSLYQYTSTGGSDTLVLDMARAVGIISSDEGQSFSEMVFHLCFKADRENRNRLKSIFPVHVDMADRFQLRDGVIAHPQHPEIGMFVPVAGGRYQWVTPEEVNAQLEASRRRGHGIR